MQDRAGNLRSISELMKKQRYAVLSTRNADGHPYANLVAFCVSKDLKKVMFCTLRSSRKFANLEAEARIALLVDNRSNVETDLQLAAAVTVLGKCQESKGLHRSRLTTQFLEKHPAMADFLNSPGCALMEMKVFSYYLVTRFQNVIELSFGED